MKPPKFARCSRTEPTGKARGVRARTLKGLRFAPFLVRRIPHTPHSVLAPARRIASNLGGFTARHTT